MPKTKTVSRTSPKGGRRACLCEDGKTYSIGCCKGYLENQGIGSLVSGHNSTINSNIEERTKP